MCQDMSDEQYVDRRKAMDYGRFLESLEAGEYATADLYRFIEEHVGYFRECGTRAPCEPGMIADGFDALDKSLRRLIKKKSDEIEQLKEKVDGLRDDLRDAGERGWCPVWREADAERILQKYRDTGLYTERAMLTLGGGCGCCETYILALELFREARDKEIERLRDVIAHALAAADSLARIKHPSRLMEENAYISIVERLREGQPAPNAPPAGSMVKEQEAPRLDLNEIRQFLKEVSKEVPRECGTCKHWKHREEGDDWRECHKPENQHWHALEMSSDETCSGWEPREGGT